MFKVKYASIPNLLLDRPLVPELLQAQCDPVTLSNALHNLLTDPAARAKQREGFSKAMNMLRPPEGTPSECAAGVVLSMMR
jgi:lipid-A-disaccharide synthase